ncbi:MAG: DNA mismatch repair protein MutS [Tannerellaceae bacterium]|nr:DNA mismatch repair protein MutS [Tannerellaceae bacterium]
MAKNEVQTPLMKQYFDIKAKYPNAILLFRVGDFYEMYGQDAIEGVNVLGIVLTRRNGENSIEMAGFPHHAIESYLPRLVAAGLRVAVCDQLEDPKMAKKLVKRGVTELVTPGLSLNDNILKHKENNFLASVHFAANKDACGVAFLDISTGEFLTAEGTAAYVDKLLNNFMPKEVIFERNMKRRFEESFGQRFLTYCMEDWTYTSDAAGDRLLKHFGTTSLKGFGVQHLKLGIIAAGAVMFYLDATQHTQLSHIISLSRIEEDRYVRLDKFTVRSLELVNAMNDGGASLLDVMDRTLSPMGSRMLRRWILFPLKDVGEIGKRQDAVDYFLRHSPEREAMENGIAQTGDLERLVSKLATGRVTPREVVQLKVALKAVESVKEACMQSDEPGLRRIGEELDACANVRDRIEREINADPPAMLNKGGTIAAGVSLELDELRAIAWSGKDYLLRIQRREAEETGIPSLKVSYNNVFGYYIEVRNTHRDKVPEGWIRKQTLVNAERYITEELKDYEEKILGAEEKIIELETRLFNDLTLFLMKYIGRVQTDAALTGRIDCLLSFSKAAEANRYVRPVVDETLRIDIKAGRHPVIERLLPPGESYVANDVFMDNEKQQVIIITGPNMAGKSALLRQTALIVLMAQTGSFVPAGSADIGLVDKIFTRVGASDNISAGESTFMVEMTEAADILNNLSARSLVLFDELGRGTSTYDGISIAWAIVEYIHEHSRTHAKTLFATHYHELNEMTRYFRRIKNYNVSVKEADNRVVFLRKLAPGGSEHSFGIHVARMAGMPKSIVKRSGEILKQLESANSGDNAVKPAKESVSVGGGYQLSFFRLDDPVLSRIRDEIKNIDIDALTPIEALNRLYEIRKIITGK